MSRTAHYTAHQITLLLKMEGQTLMFVFFLTCFVLVVSRKFPAVSSRDLKGRQGNARHRTFNSEFRLKRDLRLNEQVIHGSPSRKRYSRYVFSGPEKRSLNSETSDQDRKLFRDSSYRKNVYVPSGIGRIERSATQPGKELPAFLLYIVGHEIRKCTLDGQSETTLVHWEGKNGSPPLFVDFHYKENRIYWADSNSIHRSFFDGSGIQTIHKNLSLVEGLAVDWFGNNIYWIAKGAAKVSKTDGRYLKTLHTFKEVDRNLAVDPEKGNMYWVSIKPSPTRIMTAPMYAHTDTEEHILSDLSPGTYFAIDYNDRNLYWTAADGLGDGGPPTTPPTTIKRHKLSTDDISNDKPALVVIGLANPTSISVFEDFIYWVEENSIERANKEVRSPGQPNRGMELKNANDTVKSLKVVSGNIQKDFAGYDVCSTSKYCSHLCLPDNNAHLFRCACPDDMEPVGTLYWNRTCKCRESGQFIDLNGDCRYLDAPWNVIATSLSSSTIKLTWLPPKVRQSDQRMYMYYIFLGIYPHGVARWPVGHTNSTVFVIGHLNTKITYMVAVSYGIRGRKSFAVDITPAYEASSSTTSSPTRMSSVPRTSRQSTVTVSDSPTKQPSQSISSGYSQTMSSSVASTLSASQASSLPLHQSNKSFPYWTIGVAGGCLLLVIIVIVLLVCRYRRRMQGESIGASTFVPLVDPLEEENDDDGDVDTSTNEMFLPQLEVSNE